METDGLVPWLRAEIEADRRDADVKVIRKRWQADPGSWATGTGIIDEDGDPVAVAIGDYAARHIVRHGPLDKIADCDAKLAILAEHDGDHWCHDRTASGVGSYDYCMGGCRVIRQLAMGYASRPGYREEWRRSP